MFKHWYGTLGAIAVAVAAVLILPDISSARSPGGGWGGGRGGWGGGWGGGYGGWGYPGYYGGYYRGWGYPGYYGGYYRNYYPSSGYYDRDAYVPYSSDQPRDYATSARDNRVANVSVDLPQPDARLTANGKMTRQMGTHREFETNPIKGDSYKIDFVATWRENGREVKRTKSVTVRPGDRVAVDFMRKSNSREVAEPEQIERPSDRDRPDKKKDLPKNPENP